MPMVDAAKEEIQSMVDNPDEMAQFGVLPSTLLMLCLWLPIATQRTLLDPCWNCYDFEAAAVHEARKPNSRHLGTPR